MNVIISGLIDIKSDFKKMSNNENEIENPNKIQDTVKKILNKIRQDEDLQDEHQIKYLVDFLLPQRIQYVESTSIRCRYYVDMSKRKFR